MTSQRQLTAPMMFTDDELIALAVRNERIWGSPLPSVVGADSNDLLAAAERGWRSLVVRELAADGEIATTVQTFLQPAIAQRVTVRTFVADEAGDITAAGTVMSCYESSRATWLTEIASPEGLHTFSEAEATECRDLVRAALEEIWTSGLEVPGTWPADAPNPTALCAAFVNADKTRVVIVKHGDVRVISNPDAEPVAFSTVADALDAVGSSK